MCVLEGDVRFSSRYGMIGLRLYTVMQKESKFDLKCCSAKLEQGLLDQEHVLLRARRVSSIIIFLKERDGSERARCGDGFAIDRLPKTNKKWGGW